MMMCTCLLVAKLLQESQCCLLSLNENVSKQCCGGINPKTIQQASLKNIVEESTAT